MFTESTQVHLLNRQTNLAREYLDMLQTRRLPSSYKANCQSGILAPGAALHSHVWAFGQISNVKTSSSNASSSHISLKSQEEARGAVFHPLLVWWLTLDHPLIGARCPPWPFANCGWLFSISSGGQRSGAGTPLTCLLLYCKPALTDNSLFFSLFLIPFLPFFSWSPIWFLFLLHLVSSVLMHFQELRAAPRAELKLRQVAENLLQQPAVPPSQPSAQSTQPQPLTRTSRWRGSRVLLLLLSSAAAVETTRSCCCNNIM